MSYLKRSDKCKGPGILLAILLCGNVLFGQLQVTPGGNVAQLVQNVLLGAGVTASNVTYTGNMGGVGKFQTGSTPTNLGLSSGLMLSTGDLSNAIGPNNSTSAGTDFQAPGDALLTSIAGQQTHDAAVLEFDFVPQGDTMKFRYVFGSEEYPEFVTDLYNDIFGFFVSGTDPTTYLPFTNRNIAIVPGTTNTPVSISTINNVIPSYPQFYHDNTGGVSIQYDGFTTVLTAWCLVIPCTTYHIKLAIADAIDGIYDSGVFLEAGSFSSAGITTSVTFSNPLISNQYVIEGCDDGLVTLSMPYALVGGYVIPFTIDPSSTAIEGTDIDTLVNPLVILPGNSTVTLIVHAKADTTTDGIKTLILIVPKNICMTDFDTITFLIYDHPTLKINAGSDTSINCGAQMIIHSTKTGGYGPYTYLWTTGSTHDTTHIAPLASNYYKVTITDACNYTAHDSLRVDIIGPVANAGNDTAICQGDTATLTASGGLSYHWSNGMNTKTIKVTPSATTTYSVTVTTICSAFDSVQVTVHPLPPVVIMSSRDSLCPGDSVSLHATGAISYHWSSIPVDPLLVAQSTTPNMTLHPASTTSYMLTGTDQYSCSQSDNKQIVVKQTPTSDFILSRDQICQGEIITISYTGSGLPSSIYNWNFSGGQIIGSGAGPYAIMWDTAGPHEISLLVTMKGCLSPVSKDTVLVIPKPDVKFSGDPIAGCPPFTTFFTDSTWNTTANASYNWSFGDGNTSINTNPSHAYHKSGVYSVRLIVTNQSGCADTLLKTALVRVHPVPVASFTHVPERVTIFDPVVKFYDASMGNPVSWLWDFGDQTTSNLQNVTHTYADTGNYLVQMLITNNKGCVDSARDIAIVTPDNTIYFPTAFSPNGDGVNDIFMAYGTNLKEFIMDIFDRWGSRLFHSENINIGWDGRYQGNYVPSGVYPVIVKYRDVWGGLHSYYGRVTLIR